MNSCRASEKDLRGWTLADKETMKVSFIQSLVIQDQEERTEFLKKQVVDLEDRVHHKIMWLEMKKVVKQINVV